MVEVAIALAIATIIITGLLSATLSSLNNAQYSENLNQATQLSQEGLEAVRTISGSYSGNATYCLGTANPPALQSPQSLCATTPNVGNFIRKVTIDKTGSNNCNGLTRVTVSTYWSDGKCLDTNKYCHKSEIDSCVRNI